MEDAIKAIRETVLPEIQELLSMNASAEEVVIQSKVSEGIVDGSIQ